MANYAHPLDPLSPDEIKVTAAVVRNAVHQKKLKNLRFNTITLKVRVVLALSTVVRTSETSCLAIRQD